MKLLARLFRSTLGRKYLMAGSGGVLVLFVVGHLVGNLQFFLPPAALNRYGHLLQSNVELLWLVRLTLLAVVGLHVGMAFLLWAENRAARPVGYASPATAYGAPLSSRTMLLSGLVVAAFLGFHLLHFTVRLEAINGTPVAFHQLREPGTGYYDVFAMMVAGFQVWPVALFYGVGVGLLSFHLSHGVAAWFQSLGWRHPGYTPVIRKVAHGLAAFLLLGYLSIPAAVLLGRGNEYLQQVVEQSARPLAHAPPREEVAR
jgi:succinate dehydrogenase / fumarate reductase cytochrome b subunit